MMKPPCQFCEDRHDCCWSHCEKYIAFDKERKQISEQKRKRAQLTSDLYVLAVDRSNAWKRKAKDNAIRKKRGESR